VTVIEGREPDCCGYQRRIRTSLYRECQLHRTQPQKLSGRGQASEPLFSDQAEVTPIDDEASAVRDEKRDSDERERQGARSTIPFAKSILLRLRVAGLLIRGTSRHEICAGSPSGETADEWGTAGNGQRSRRTRSTPGQLPLLDDATVEPIGQQNNLDLLSPTFMHRVDHLRRLPRSRPNWGARNQDEVRQGDRRSHFTRTARLSTDQHEAARKLRTSRARADTEIWPKAISRIGNSRLPSSFFCPVFPLVAAVVLCIDLEKSCECCANK
jgi:hypothetical protein